MATAKTERKILNFAITHVFKVRNYSLQKRSMEMTNLINNFLLTYNYVIFTKRNIEITNKI